MPSFDSIIVGEDWISEHYFTTDSTKESFQGEVLKRRKIWDEDGKAGHTTALTRFSQHRGELQVSLAELAEDPSGAQDAYKLLRIALGFNGTVAAFTAQRSGTETVVPFVWNGAGGETLFLESEPADSIEDFLGASRPLGRVISDGKEDTERTTAKLISELYLADTPPKYIVAMAGKWLVLTEQERWAEGRYLAADVLLVADRNDGKKGQEIDRFLASFGRDSLAPSPDGTIWWDEILESSVKHTVGVSKDLREGIRRSIEIIANDVLARRATTDIQLEAIDGQVLARQSLRFLYRILFLLYAEASPELGVLPVGAGEYNEGYGLDRLRELTLVEIHEDSSLRGTHIFESLNGLFRLVDSGHNPGAGMEEGTDTSANEGLRFDALKADLFDPNATSLINDTKLSNGELQLVLQYLLLSKESRGKDRGFISYAELGINQLGAVYEGLMSYTGFIAETDLHEVAKDGDASKGSWVVPTNRSESIESKHFIKERNERTDELETVVHPKGSFVFRLAGRERQQSASYYTPEVLTKFVVSQALEELLDQDGKKTAADDILKLTVCEPALGSGAFAIEAVRQLAGEYLKRKQDELDIKIPADEYPQELQKVKAQIALHQVHGVDLNSTAVELAEVSLWLDTMVKDLQAPWFGLRLRRGNSLIGARRATYSSQSVKDKSWLTSAPQDAPLVDLVDAMECEIDDDKVVGRIHHFLLPAAGWGAASDAKEVKDLASDAQKALKAWRNSVKNKPSKGQIDRVIALGRRVESLWKLSLRRLQVAEHEARREIYYFGRPPSAGKNDGEAVSRAEIEKTLGDPNGAYQRLRRVMDAWNALWFWPITELATDGATPPNLDEWFTTLEKILGLQGKDSKMVGQRTLAASSSWEELNDAEHIDLQLSLVADIDEVKASHPWLAVCEEIAADQGFFHWELDFAPVFGRGGFDLQVGNPPWVRPDWDEKAIFAEHDPWWQLVDKSSQTQSAEKRAVALADAIQVDFMCNQAASIVAVREFLTDVAVYPIVSGLRPDLYRSFMERTWVSASPSGIVALIHPESHFTEKKAAHLRAETYRRLRRHWQFLNELQLFEISNHVVYGVHVYGKQRVEPAFKMAASLYHPDTIKRSEDHDGSGEVPGLKDSEGKWDTRPHAERIIEVDESVLSVWADILDEPGTPAIQARMVYPVNRASSRVLEKLSKAPRVRELDFQFSSGWNETTDRKKGYFEVGSAVPEAWDDVILQGPHFTVANPFAKQPNTTMKSNKDWTEIDLEALPADFIPRTSYQPAGNRKKYDVDSTIWTVGDQIVSSRSVYRMSWRSMAARTGYRTLYPSIVPPGTTHVHAVRTAGSIKKGGLQALVKTCGILMSLPVDFLVKSAVGSEISSTFIDQMPVDSEILLDKAIKLRVLQLTTLTEAYAPLWEALQDSPWNRDSAARTAAGRRQLMVEIDAISALLLGLTSDDLCTIYRTQFPVLRGYEQNDLYDNNGRKLPGEINKLYRQRGESLSIEDRSWTHPQSGVEYVFEFPFQGFDREVDMRTAYAHFEQLLAEKQNEELVK